MNQSNWYSQQPYPGYEVQELENSHPANQDPSHQLHPTSHNHIYDSKPVNGANNHYAYSPQQPISTGSSHPNFNNLQSGKSKDQRLAAAKQRYRQIPRDEPAPSQPWNLNSDPSTIGYQPSYAENYYGGQPSTPGPTGFMPHHHSYNHPLQSDVPSTPHRAADSPAASSQENDLRNERRRQMERQRRQKDNEILARAEYSRDPILLEQAEMIRAKRKRKEDRAQMRYKMMSDDKKEELRQRKRMQQRMRDMKKMQEE